MKAFKEYIDPDIQEYFKLYDKELVILGEIFGQGIQDLHYGETKPRFRVFDIKYDGQWFLPVEVRAFCETHGLDFVPCLYEGLLTWDVINEYTNGKDTLSKTHVKEGIVIRTLEQEFNNPEIGRVFLKSVSDDYLNRKNPTEYN